jgi:peptide/nickel transport system substrate-binding protein
MKEVEMSRNISRSASRQPISRRKLIAAGLSGGAAIASVGLGACSTANKGGGRTAATAGASGAQASSGTPKLGGTFNGYYTNDPPLDPRLATGFAQWVVGGAWSRVFRFQTTTDPKFNTNHELENDLGVSAESPDGITWTVKLRPDAKFHNVPPVNGHAVEAEDVKDSWARMTDPAGHFQYLGNLGYIDPAQITTPDKQTVVFKLKYPYAPFKRTLAQPIYGVILPREGATGVYDPAKLVIGSGPFMFVNHVPDAEFDLKKNPDWFEKGRPYVDGIKLALYDDPTNTNATQIAQFTAGHLDDLRPPFIQDVPTIKQGNPKATFIQQDQGTPLTIRMQLGDSSSAFRDIRVRQAFSMALDRNAINQTMFQGDGVLSISIPTSLGKWALTASDMPADTQKYFKYDLAQAKQLLSAAGAQNTRFKFAVVRTGALSTGNLPKLADTVYSMLTPLGVQIDQVPIDYDKDWVAGGHGYRQGNSPPNTFFVDTQSPLYEPDEILYGYFSSQSTSNPEHLSDPDLDALVTKERSTLNDDDRIKVVWDIQKYIAAKMYVIPTGGAAHNYFFVQPRVQNYCPTTSFAVETEIYSKAWLNA